MSSSLAAPRRARERASRQRHGAQKAENSRVYVYGIVPADTEVESGLSGVGEPPSEVSIVRHGDVGALISEVSGQWTLGSPRDLTVHKRILDGSAEQVPVLPLRFGSLLENADLVIDQLLAANHDVFAEALSELEGRVQYVVKGRYQEEAILREVLAENREAARLRARLRAVGPAGSDRIRLRLGEIVGRSIEAKREQDTNLLASWLARHSEASVIRPPQHERDAVHIAVLLRVVDAPDLQQTVGDQAARWQGRVDLRLLGPMAAYDFVATTGGS